MFLEDCEYDQSYYCESTDFNHFGINFYKGYIKELNSYVIKKEGNNFLLINKNTGKSKLMSGFPLLSPNKKYIINSDTYNGVTTISLWQQEENNGEFHQKYTTDYRKWIISLSDDDIFWGNDGYLYLAASHKESFWNDVGNPNEIYQYLKIEILDE